MKIVPVIILAAGILLTAACAHLEPALPPQAKADPKSAVIYGRFSLADDFAFKNKMALWLENMDTRHPLYLYFDHGEPLYSVRVKPGAYRIMGFVGLNRTHEIKTRSPIRLLQTVFYATAGSETYLGDFTGMVKWDSVFFIWGIKSCTNNFAATTAEFRAKYPLLTPTSTQSVFGARSPIPEHPMLF